jgi:hypothetical protein
MLRNYNDIEKLTKLYDKILLTRILNDLDFGHFSYYIIKILTNYNIPYLSIIIIYLQKIIKY